jgi:hypothetical protein
VLDLVRELEQHDECRRVVRELEQRPVELEQQQWVSRGLRLFPQASRKGIVEPQGYVTLL